MRRVLITGANKGIGLASVSAVLATHEDVFVYLGTRSKERGLNALTTLLASQPTWESRIQVLELDVTSDDSVISAAQQITKDCSEGSPLYGLVNNAGVGAAAGDLEYVLQVNAWGPKRVCDAFLPIIDSSNGRIVNVTSASGPNFVSRCNAQGKRFFLDSEMDWETLNAFMKQCISARNEQYFQAMGVDTSDAYGLSKACANSLTLLLARQNPNLNINACTPGFIETDLTRPMAEANGLSPRDAGMKAPVEGTGSTVHLLFGELTGNGHYYGSDAVRSPMHYYRAPGDPVFDGDVSFGS